MAWGQTNYSAAMALNMSQITEEDRWLLLFPFAFQLVALGLLLFFIWSPSFTITTFSSSEGVKVRE